MAATNLYKKFLQGIGLIPKATTSNAVLGDLESLSTTNRLMFFGATNDASRGYWLFYLALKFVKGSI